MFNKTVDSITKVFTQAIKDLDALCVSEQSKITRYNKVAQEVKEATQDSELQIKRASDVRAKLQSIIN